MLLLSGCNREDLQLFPSHTPANSIAPVLRPETDVMLYQQLTALGLGPPDTGLAINTPWMAYLQGKPQAINEAAKQGALLFFQDRREGGYGCAACHQGKLFTDEKSYNVLSPPLQAPSSPLEKPDSFTVRTPSLLNVAMTGPWGYNGAYTRLEDAVRHMLNPFQAILDYEPNTASPPLTTAQWQKNLQDLLHQDADLSGQSYPPEDVQKLVAFLQTLTEHCTLQHNCRTAPP